MLHCPTSTRILNDRIEDIGEKGQIGPRPTKTVVRNVDKKI